MTIVLEMMNTSNNNNGSGSSSSVNSSVIIKNCARCEIFICMDYLSQENAINSEYYYHYDEVLLYANWK